MGDGPGAPTLLVHTDEAQVGAMLFVELIEIARWFQRGFSKPRGKTNPGNG